MEIVEKVKEKATAKKQTKNITEAVLACEINVDSNAAAGFTEGRNAASTGATIGEPVPNADKVNAEKSTTTISTSALTVAEKIETKSKDHITLIGMKTIAISDEEDSPTPVAPQSDVLAKKRKSVVTKAGEEDRFRLKRRKIKVAGAPKMPLTGYVRYMNDRREELKKEQPNKTAMEHTKLIGEEWNQLSEGRKAPYMTAAELDKQRYLTELHVFLKARPDVLACELAKNKPRKSTGGVVEPVGAGAKTNGNEKSTAYGTGTYKNTKEAVKQLTKDDLAITASATKARSIMHTRRLSVNYAMPTYLSKESSPPAAAIPDINDKIKQKSATVGIASCPEAAPVATNEASLAKHKRSPTPISNNNCNNCTPALFMTLPAEIPIFTNEFLEHNKAFDMELRTLRKSKADLEQQNAVLEKHVENMKFGVEKIENENDELQEKNRLLEIYLDKLKRKLANALSGLAIPSEPQGATVENIEKYMNDIYKMSTSNTHGPASLNKAKDIIRKLDLQIRL